VSAGRRDAAPRRGAGPASLLPHGRVVRRACHGNPAQEYFVYVPESARECAPVLAAVHGISRNAHELAERFAAHCEERGVLLIAPYFPPEPFRDYQRLGRSGRGPRADAALHAILEEITWLMGADTSRFRLFGFSGGAQFVHRYTMAHPHRVERAVAAAAGWYTFPDARLRYPFGIRPTRELPGVRFDPEEFLSVPITAIVGDRDTLTAELRRTPRVRRMQGETRLERARSWVDSMRAAARAYRVPPRVTLQLVPGGDHSFANLMRCGQLGERVFEALFETRSVRAAREP
jgi:dienelactone hydrolase